jgi:hypothetical protein
VVSVSVRQNRPEPVGRNARSPRPRPGEPDLIEHTDGYYDRTGRRLFLADGAPDPATPGAYRYQAHPDLCDPAAPETDPASPRYEPPHLRHRPGDTWIIDRDRPHDPDDPGPYGTSGWRPDPRTGRHRRDELPDPPQERTVAPDGPPIAADDPPTAKPRHPATAAGPPPRRSRYRRDDETQAAATTTPEAPYRFSKLREDAWDRFLINSAHLAAAHPVERSALDRRHRRPVAWLLAMLHRLLTTVKGPQRTTPKTSAIPETTRAPQTPKAAEANGAQPSRRPASQLAQALSGAQSARRERLDGTGHWRTPPRPERPKPSPVPYMARWERAFDAGRELGGLRTMGVTA